MATVNWVLSQRVWDNEDFRKTTPVFALIVTEPDGNIIYYGYADYYEREVECDAMLQTRKKDTRIQKRLCMIDKEMWEKLDKERKLNH